MSGLDYLYLLFAVLLIAGNGVFVAAEFSMVALDPAATAARAKTDPRARIVSRSLHDLSLHLSACQVGITLTTILLGYVGQQPLTDLFTLLFESAGMARAAAIGVSATLAFVLVNFFSMLFGELVPKNLALADMMGAAYRMAPILHAFSAVFKPLIVVLNDSANWILRQLGVEPVEELSGARSASELGALVRQSAEAGTLEASTATLLTRSLGVGKLTAVDVMTNRTRVASISEDATAEDVVNLAVATGYSRFPVVADDLDAVRGIVQLRRAVAIPYERRADVPVTSSSIMWEAPRVPETMSLSQLLVELRDTGIEMALVVDEYGGTSGVVTVEDAVEEIVGNIADEHDPRRASARHTASGSWVLSALLRPDEATRLTGFDLPADGPFETIAGLVVYRLGRLARVGDRVRVGGVDITVTVADARRIRTVEVSKHE
ncbi:hemolysin family protein [Neoactinobaculum massilliense]|uniref:hemolysin family protein n=1 Tax=Neoactinobaculum massilliense TaxID=2364794 RepID=UPI001F151EF0|nr:hemolysin family protein [Neoactinobaculum massilliense]